MPYVDEDTRAGLDPEVLALVSALRKLEWNAGAVNYTFTRVVLTWFYDVRRYGTIASITGVLTNVAQEFYRRHAVHYEVGKQQDNGDVSAVPKHRGEGEAPQD